MLELRKHLVLRYDPERTAWSLVREVDAVDPGAAFRKAVLPEPGMEARAAIFGEYLTVPLDECAHIAVELHLRDLAAPVNPARADGGER